MTLLIAGHETTASALAWTFSELGCNPEVRDWLLSEITAIGPDPSPEQLASLPALLSGG